MAEALAVVAVIASVAQLADLGCKLSVKLFAFSQSAATADESIRGISSDVSLTSTVLQELSLLIKADESRIVSSTAIEATRQTVAECWKIFEHLDEALEKAIGNGGESSKGKGKRGMSTFERLKFPFKVPKLDLLRSNLERLKTSLSLMLQVLSYARDVSNRKAAETSLAYQHNMIEALARSQELAEKRYNSLRTALEYQEHPSSFNTFISASFDPSSSRGLDRLLVEPDTITTKIKSNNVEPPTSSKMLVHELLLCFNLLNEVTFHHINEKGSSDPISDYDELDKATNKIKKQEISSLGYDPACHFPQAAKNLTRRLEKLSTPGTGPHEPLSHTPKIIHPWPHESPVTISNGIQPVAQAHEVELPLSPEPDLVMTWASISNSIQTTAQDPETESLISPERGQALHRSNGIRVQPAARDHDVESPLSSRFDHAMAEDEDESARSSGFEDARTPLYKRYIAQDPEDEYEDARCSSAMTCSPQHRTNRVPPVAHRHRLIHALPVAHRHKPVPILFPEDQLLVGRGNMRQPTGKKHFPGDFFNPTKALPTNRTTNASVTGYVPSCRNAKLLTINPQSTAWGSIKSAGAMAGKGISNFGSEMYVAVRAGSSWLIGDNDDNRNPIDSPKPMTVNDAHILQIGDPVDDNGGNDTDSTRDIVDDLLAKWTNLPPGNA